MLGSLADEGAFPKTTPCLSPAHMDRMGATMSREAMRMPSSAMSAVRRSAHVGSPFAFPWPNTCGHQKRSCSYHLHCPHLQPPVIPLVPAPRPSL